MVNWLMLHLDKADAVCWTWKRQVEDQGMMISVLQTKGVCWSFRSGFQLLSGGLNSWISATAGYEHLAHIFVSAGVLLLALLLSSLMLWIARDANHTSSRTSKAVLTSELSTLSSLNLKALQDLFSHFCTFNMSRSIHTEKPCIQPLM